MARTPINTPFQVGGFFKGDTFVDLSPEPVKAKVVREGFQVPVAAINEQKATFFLDNLTAVPPKQQPRVVSQTIKPGTKVLPGTAVDLVLAPTSTIPFDIMDNVHTGLAGKKLNALDPILDNATVRQTLLKYSNAADVTAADKVVLSAAFGTVGMTVDETKTETGFGAAFNAAHGALAFR